MNKINPPLNLDVSTNPYLAFKAVELKKDIEMDNGSFRKGLKRLRKERYQIAKNLSKR